MVAPRKPPTKWERTKKILWDSNINAPIRGTYNMLTTDDMDRALAGDEAAMERTAGNSADVAMSGVGMGSLAPKPRGAITMGVGRPRGVKPSATPRVSLFSKNARAKVDATLAAAKAAKAKVGEIKDSGGGPSPAPSRTPGQKRLMDTLNASRDANAKSRAARDAGGGTAPAPLRRPRPGEKKFIGPMDKPKPGDRRFIGPRERPKPGEKEFIGPMDRPKPGEKGFIGPMKAATFADKGGNGRLGKYAKYGAGAAIVGGAALGLRSPDQPRGADRKNGGISGGDSRMTPNKIKSFKEKRQGMNVEGSPTNPATKKAGPTTAKAPGKATDKSRAAPKKMNAFEQMKQRQYEKEGHGGRMLTASGAKAQVLKERSYKFKDLFGKKK